MGKAQRRKGHNFERWVANQFREAGFEAKRCLQYAGPEEGPDVLAESSQPLNLPFLVECKNQKRPPYRKAYEQACALCLLPQPWNGIPVAVVKETRKEPLVLISLEDFLNIVKG